MRKVEICSLADLRKWLTENCEQKESVWLVRWKKPHPSYVQTTDIIDELLCFGWIDSLPRKLDDERTMLRISPRNPKSAWSKVNKEKVAKLADLGRMMPAGLVAVEAAKASGLWSKLDEVDALIEPDDLKRALEAEQPTLETWQAYPPSVRRGALEIVENAKLPTTRARKIAQILESARNGDRPFQWRKD